MTSARFIADIGRDPQVGLTFAGRQEPARQARHLHPIAGSAQVIRDKAAFAEHWIDDLDAGSRTGIDTPGMVMLKISAQRVHYWDGEESGEVSLG